MLEMTTLFAQVEPVQAVAPILFDKFGMGIGIGLVILGAGLGIGKIGGAAVEAMSRQPENSGTIQTAMIIAAGLVEGGHRHRVGFHPGDALRRLSPESPFTPPAPLCHCPPPRCFCHLKSFIAAAMLSLILGLSAAAVGDEVVEVGETQTVQARIDADSGTGAPPPAISPDADVHDHDIVGGQTHEGEQHGDEGGSGLLSVDFGSAVWNLLIFLGVLAILSTFVWPQVLNGLKAREDKIREDLLAAEAANRTAQKNLAGYQSQLDEASTKVSEMIAQARVDAEAAGQRIIDEAKAEAVGQRERALADIDNAKKVALAELADETSAMAMSVARSVVGRELRPQDHADLIRDAMRRVPSKN